MLNFEKINQIAADNNIPIWFTTPQGRTSYNEAQRAQLVELKSLLYARFGDKIIDFWTDTTTDDAKIEPIYDADGIHMNDAGHLVLFNHIANKNITKNLDSKLYLTGAAAPCGWSNTSPEKMQYTDGVFAWEGNLKAGDFKFLTELSNWNKCFNSRISNEKVYLGGDKSHSMAYNLSASAKNDHKFIIIRDGRYKVTMDPQAMQVTVTEIKDPNKPHIICIGNSVTAGHDLNKNPWTYPMKLEEKLEGNYTVANYGKGGTNMQTYWTQGHMPYAEVSNPDIVIIKLGSNDTGINQTYFDEEKFRDGLIKMINFFAEMKSKPKIYVGVSCYVTSDVYLEFPVDGTRISDVVAPIQRKVAQDLNLETLDFHLLIDGRDKDLYINDKVHLNLAGANALAAYAAKVITNKPVAAIPARLEFRGGMANVKNKKALKISARNLTGDLAVSISGEGYSTTTTTIPRALAEQSIGYDLMVTFEPNAIEEGMTGAITISGGGIDTQTVMLSGNGREIFLVGDATPENAWNNTKGLKMNAIDGELTWTGTLKAGHFKFITRQGTWNSSYEPYYINENIDAQGVKNHRIDYIPSARTDRRFVVTQGGQYTINLDMQTETFTIKKEQIDKLWATGSALSNQIVETVLNGSDVYAYAGELNAGELKFITTSTINSETKYIIPATGGVKVEGTSIYQVTTDANIAGWNVPTTNPSYKVQVDMNQGKLKGEIAKTKSNLYLVGGASPDRWSLSAAIPFIKDPLDPNVFTLECELTPQGAADGRRIKIIGQRSWNGFSFRPEVEDTPLSENGYYFEVIAPAKPDYKWTVTEAGLYKLTVNTLKGTFSAKNLTASKKLNLSIENKNSSQDLHAVVIPMIGNVEVSLSDTNGGKQVSAELISITSGRVFANLKTNESTFTLGNNVPAGVYVVRISYNNKNISKKVFIK